MLGCVPSSMNNLQPRLSSRLDNMLRILTWAQAIFGCILTVVNMIGGLVMVMCCMILYSIRFYGNICSCICYMIIAGLEALTSAVLIVAVISHSAEAQPMSGLMLWLNMFKLPFYLVTGYYVYLSYKELNSNLISYSDAFSYRSLNSQPNAPGQRTDSSSNFRAFSGEGYRIG